MKESLPLLVVAYFLLRVLLEGDSSKVEEGSATDLFLLALVFLAVFLPETSFGVACSLD